VEASIERFVRRQLDKEMAADCHDDDEDGVTTAADCKMRRLYARCMDTDTVDSAGAQPLQYILDDLGGWSALGL